MLRMPSLGRTRALNGNEKVCPTGMNLGRPMLCNDVLYHLH